MRKSLKFDEILLNSSISVRSSYVRFIINFFLGQDLDMRSLDPRSATRVTQPPPPPQPQAQDQDLRIPPMVPPPSQPPTMAQMPQFPQEQ